MDYDPRRKRISAILQTIRQNPYVKNSNSMIGPLYEEVLRLQAELAEAKELLAKATEKRPSRKTKTEKPDGDAPAE